MKPLLSFIKKIVAVILLLGYIFGTLLTLQLGLNAVIEIIMEFVHIFTRFSFSVEVVGLGIFKVLVSMMLLSFMYILFAGSNLSPIYILERNKSSKLPIGR